MTRPIGKATDVFRAALTTADREWSRPPPADDVWITHRLIYETEGGRLARVWERPARLTPAQAIRRAATHAGVEAECACDCGCRAPATVLTRLGFVRCAVCYVVGRRGCGRETIEQRRKARRVT